MKLNLPKHIGKAKNHTVDVGRISKALNKFKFKQKPLSPIIWILVHVFWPKEKSKSISP